MWLRNTGRDLNIKQVRHEKILSFEALRKGLGKQDQRDRLSPGCQFWIFLPPELCDISVVKLPN